MRNENAMSMILGNLGWYYNLVALNLSSPIELICQWSISRAKFDDIPSILQSYTSIMHDKSLGGTCNCHSTEKRQKNVFCSKESTGAQQTKASANNDNNNENKMAT